MRPFIFMAAAILLSCGQNSSSDNKTKIPADTNQQVVSESPPAYATPDEGMVNASLSALYGNKWRVMNDKDARWMKDAFDYFIIPRRKENANYPYIAKGDYNADGKADIAAIVTDSLKRNFQIAIILGTDNIIFWKEDISNDAAISNVPKSEIDGMDGEKTKKVKMKSDGINVEYFESASFVLYWDKSSLKRIQTGD